MEDFKDGCKYIAMAIVLAAIILAAAIKKAHAEEGPWSVHQSTLSFNCHVVYSTSTMPDWYVEKKWDCATRTIYDVDYSTVTFLNVDIEEMAKDLASALNAAHARRSCRYPLIECGDPTFTYSGPSHVLTPTDKTAPCSDSK